MNAVSVIILTFNEEINLPAALDSVKGWAEEVFIVDSYSTDRTVDIALSRASDKVRVVQHAFENYSAHWNWALTHLPITSAWTLKLDADERVTEEFRTEVSRVMDDAQPDVEGIYFRRRFFFAGSPLLRGGFSYNFDLRMWRTGKARFEDRSVNEHALVKGKTVRIESHVNHSNYKSISDWLDKHNRYSSLEAQSIIKGNITGDVRPCLWGNPAERRMFFRLVFRHMPARHLFYFIYRFIFRLGFLDGKGGFRYSFLHAAYLFWIDMKIDEYKLTDNLPEIIWPMRGQPHPQVAGSALQKLVDAGQAFGQD
jgi:glycosyltransferase involved in cell wall biosynthesis